MIITHIVNFECMWRPNSLKLSSERWRRRYNYKVGSYCASDIGLISKHILHMVQSVQSLTIIPLIFYITQWQNCSHYCWSCEGNFVINVPQGDFIIIWRPRRRVRPRIPVRIIIFELSQLFSYIRTVQVIYMCVCMPYILIASVALSSFFTWSILISYLC